ncbi:MAG TPA: phosphoribosylglycinamide formyltransferase [Patescibacteria group bacterium]|jgi:formyltetrahydrofolate-dependent phosphoribosylglycinamide formyltransferase|nr:phosphoribosylglycinamide formyltransferase [Patescibacteria group bacterium]
MTLRLGVLGSTRGTALQGVIEAIEAGTLDAKIVLIVSDKPDALILQRGLKHGIHSLHIGKAGLTREAFDAEVTEEFKRAHADLILMVGYMRIVSAAFVKAWEGKILNVHPSLLPEFAGGMNRDVHRAVIESGAKKTGCTIHIVTEDVDAGPILLQKQCEVLPGDTVETLKERVQALEQQAFVEVLQKWGK